MKIKLPVSLSLILAMCSAEADIRTITIFRNPNIESHGGMWVCFGIPVKAGILESAEDLQIFDKDGNAVEIFAKPVLTWFPSAREPGGIRSVKVQLKADPGAEGLSYTFDFEGRDTSKDLGEQPVEQLTAASPVDGKAGVREPFGVAVLNPEYLAQADLIPPYKPARGDAYDEYIEKQFDRDWGPFNFETSRGANWLFDRTTTLYKYAMRSGRPEAYIEAYRSYQWWFNHLSRDGDCVGGFDFDGKGCDSKYIYTEPVKLHLALTGDDSDYEPGFVKAMAETAWDRCWAGKQGLKSPYQDLNQPLTERHIGLTLLALLNAYELTGDPALMERILQGIDNIHQAQNGPNPDGLANDGSIRHSWYYHEGELPYLGQTARESTKDSILLENVADISLVDRGAPLLISPDIQATATGTAVKNSDGTWTIPLSTPLAAAIPAGETVYWGNTNWTMIPGDRGFSPWMFENITDALWHAYAVIDTPAIRAKIETYFREAGKALALHAFVPESLNPATRALLEGAYNYSYTDYGEEPRLRGSECSSMTPVLLYFGSSTAAPAAMAATKHRYTDQHSPETILTLSLASRFEENLARKEALARLVEDLSLWFASDCANARAGGGLPWRGFNWQHRSNAWGTHLWTVSGR